MIAMTGYGRGEASNGTLSISIEIRSSANRSRDINIRVPKGYLSLEPRIRRLISQTVHRGRVDIFVQRNSLDSTHKISSDPILAERYLLAMQHIAKRIQKEANDIPLTTIMQQPGVLNIKEDLPDANAEWVLVSTALQAATDHLQMHRVQQGIEKKKKLQGFIHELQQKRSMLEESYEGIQSFLFNKLEGRLKRLLGGTIPPKRLAQEAAILVDKSDVSQEFMKCRIACDQLLGIIEKTEPFGRKIDFILQELSRNINIIAAKLADHSSTTTIIDIKTILEYIREEAHDLE